MKTKIALIALIIAGLIGTANMAFATAQKTDGAAAKAIQAVTETKTFAFRGLVKETPAGITLFDGKETYVLKGNKLDELVGKIVVVTGKIQKTDKTTTILVKKAARAD